MIGSDAILEYARRRGVDPFWIENDYLQHVALMHLFDEFSNDLVFKGGTALQKIYGLNRLSRDMDFNLFGADPKETLEAVAKKISYYYKTSCKGPIPTKHGEGFSLLIEGPSYKETGRHVLPVTFNQQEKIEMAPIFKTINPMVYYEDPDLRVYSLLAMDEIEILAEKIRAAVTRKDTEPRDFYDIWFMLNAGIKVNSKMVSRKVEFDHGRFSNAIFRRKLRSIKKDWEKALAPLVKPLPGYKEIADYLSKKFV